MEPASYLEWNAAIIRERLWRSHNAEWVYWQQVKKQTSDMWDIDAENKSDQVSIKEVTL
jgi:hypothetical protein